MPARTVRLVGEGLSRGVPVASPEAAAVFRILFTALTLGYLLLDPARLPEQPPTDASYASAVVRWLTANPGVADHLGTILIVTALAVIAGAATRVAFAAFVAAFLAWACLRTTDSSHHPISAFAVLMIALLPARWADAWSLDAWIRRRLGRDTPPLPSRRYGFALWLPGLVIGVTFAAAAWSKVASGPEWILNGTIRYHFVTDLHQALVTWGPWLTSLPGVAMAGSFAAVAVEALLIGAAFLRGWRLRALAGAAALSLLAGFALFQGVIWWLWWLLLLGFVPWHLFVKRPRTLHADQGIGLAQAAAVIFVLVQQIVITTRHVEARPLFSTYDMYSTTYADAQQYEAKSNLVYRVVGVTAGGTRVPLEDCQMSDAEAVALAPAPGQAPLDSLGMDIVRSCLEGRPDVAAVVLEGDRRVYDWDAGGFSWKRALDTRGPLDVATLN